VLCGRAGDLAGRADPGGGASSWHGAMYDAVNQGVVEPERLRRVLVSLAVPRVGDGRPELRREVLLLGSYKIIQEAT
jgi:hypothetical protein